MTNKYFPKSNLPIRRTVELLPSVFQTSPNDKFLSGVLDPLVQPGVLDKVVGYAGRKYGKTYLGKDVYVDTDNTLRSRYQLEPGIIYKNNNAVENFYDYIDLKNQLKFFGNDDNRDDKITSQTHYTWTPPIDWDKFINYREYFWLPSGPPAVPIYGQSSKITSTYKVVLGTTTNSFIFTPDSYTNNPTITLYRGQTYKFKVNAPNERFYIKTNYDSGSLMYVPENTYVPGSLVVYNEKLWKAKTTVYPSDGSSITLDSQDWEYVEPSNVGAALLYNKGVTNNGVENGTLTFEVPFDAPDILYYQSGITPDCFGRFIISDIEANTYIDVEKEIVGKSTYTSSNGISLTNGLVIEFLGKVYPSKFSTDTWLVQGVGEAITLTKFSDLIVPVLTKQVPEVLFDDGGFDTQPFDDATAYPTFKDYITISKDSRDSNPWSRYNRWFHRNTLEYAYSLRGQDFEAAEETRAKRPIIEFKSNLQLFNHGSVAKTAVDYIDTYTLDVFSDIEGSTGYNIDGEFLFEGARILIVADKDNLANNKIYEVTFITHNNRRQIHLKDTFDTESIIGECVLVRRGTINAGTMYHFNGTNWVPSQTKTSVNQSPMFDAFNESGVSFSDPATYPTSSFTGTSILSYKVGNGKIDSELGFNISYLNINNIGDIEFKWNWGSEHFEYTIDRIPYTKQISTGFYKINPNEEYLNGWSELDNEFVQPIVDSQVVKSSTNILKFNTVNWIKLKSEPIINFYVNGTEYSGSWTRNVNEFTFSSNFTINDSVSIKVITDLEPDQGYYEIPVGLETNPLNNILETFTLGQAVDHIFTALEFNTEIKGLTPGVSNLRDISGYQKYAKRFLIHSGLVPLSMMLLCDKKHNIIKAIQYNKKSYTDFKNNFLIRSLELDYNDNTVNFVDDIITSLTKTKNENSSFSDSDMIGAGAYSKITYTVEDTGISVFSLSEKFDLKTLSRNAVYVYLNGTQLLNTRDYEFDSTFGFVKLLVVLNEGDVVEIREYVSTATNHIPPTPTSMGLYKKYIPMKFLDDTYVEPRLVIQGHDGSITAAFEDFRDDLLLELEYRIYNNIKKEYDPSVFDIDSIIGGYNGVGLYKKSQLDDIVNQEFLKWIQNTNINYTLNEYFDSENSFTYTYSNMTDPTGNQNLPGYWRGVYQWFYDTDRPHRCPWEMLGFSIKPGWWEDEYGPAPYTRGNLILWEDLANGIIRQGPRAGTYDRYKRPTILNHIPVDGDGKLLSPLDSGLAQNFSLINNKGPFVLGDIAPVEYAWRSSSEWPFAVVMAMCLMKPFEYITDNFDTSKTKLNKLNQTVSTATNIFTDINNLLSYDLESLSAGLVKYLTSYTRSRGLSVDTLWNKISNLDVALSYRMSGFVDQQQQKFLLDSKNPGSKISSVYVPQENYNIIFNVSSPISNISYSGVILEKTEGGWIVTGYDDIHPFFNYHQPMANNKDSVISVGGISEKFTDWIENKIYSNGVLVRNGNYFYRAIKTHNSQTSFDVANWQLLTNIPKLGAIEAFRRTSFNTLSVRKLSYGTKLTNIQQVVDFLLGYESYLKSVGFIFDRYDPENKVSQDWLTSCKEFMFWTKHNWSIGSLLSVSPAAEKINVKVPIGVADNILDGFYDYQILKGDGKPLDSRYINVNRSFQNITVETTNTTDGIYYIKLYYVLKEHVTIFDDRTVFNDIIYDKTTGYRQGRIKVQGFRTTDWDGDYTSPGFLFDNVDIKPWQPFIDYKLGDIVSYKSYNWTSLKNQLGSETFDDTAWSKLDTTPTKQLISNFDYRIKGTYDFFEVSSDGLDQSQRSLARHTIGYQPRGYLQNISEDPVTQFQLYQGFIREKGTSNAITKIFEKLSRSGTDSITLNEEWAFLVGRAGGVDQISEIEIQIEKNKIELNPQLFVVNQLDPIIKTDQNYSLTISDFTIAPYPYDINITPLTLDQEPTFTAGYVSTGEYEHVISSREDLTTLDIFQVKENDHVWITFDKDSWTVLRANESPSLYVTDVSRKDKTIVSLTLNRPHSIVEGDYIGIRYISNLTGFFKVLSTTNIDLDVEILGTSLDPKLDSSTIPYVTLFTESRFKNYQGVDVAKSALYKNKSRLFVDDNGDGLWEVVEKTKEYFAKSISDYGTSTPLYAGTKVVYDNNYKNIFCSIPGSGFVIVYAESDTGLVLKQIISPPAGTFDAVLGSFGNSMAVSPDGNYLIVGAPNSSGIKTNFTGAWQPDEFYQEDDIVLYGGSLWRAVNSNTVLPDGSTNLGINTDDWEQVTVIPNLSSGRTTGPHSQGLVAIYKNSGGRFSLVRSLVSPRPAENEKFGSDISIGFDGSSYYLAVSAIGANNNTGRVYLLKGSDSDWQGIINPLYKGIYNPLGKYFTGDIVWQTAQDPIEEGVSGQLWQALEDQIGDGSTLTLESGSWVKVSNISTDISVPTNIAVDDDGSTLAAGILSNSQLAELIKSGDKFGFSTAMNSDGSLLVVGAPYSDGQYFPSYKGIWRSDIEYVEGDVVKYKNPLDQSYVYYKLFEPVGFDSTYRSLNEDPSNTSVWTQISDSTVDPSGKVFVYKRTAFGSYELKQMINAGSLVEFTDIDSNLVIATGDEFGYSLDMDADGKTLVISRPKADTGYQDQGSVYVFGLDISTTEFRVIQKLESYEIYPDEYFGHGVSISPDGYKIVVGAKNSPTTYSVYFDILLGTYFDNGRTSFSVNQGYTGGVYIFDKKDQTFFLTEKIDTELTENEAFGFSVDCVGSVVLVGSPYYKGSNSQDYTGIVRLFRKDETVSSWNVVSQRSSLVDIRKIRSIELYDNVKNVKIQDIDYIDPAKGKILNSAEKEIKFKTPYDPAVYTIGNENTVVDSSIAWYEKNVGQLWWNISTAKWIYAEQGDYANRLGNWNTLAQGASIDVYEWVETVLLPSEWSVLADTNEGLTEGISGQPLYPNDDVYSIKQFYNSTSGSVSKTLYYYWVKNKSTIPNSTVGRNKSATEVANLILNPFGSDVAFMTFLDSNKFATYNFESVMGSDTALLNIQYKKDLNKLVPIHSEYQLLTEGAADSVPTKKLEDKWIDSLVGYDLAGNRVPDNNLPAKQKYGISYRPRQSMFVDRISALKIAINNINNILSKEPFTDEINFTNLNLVDSAPSEILNSYDVTVDNEIDLQNVGTVRIKKAVLKANLVNGELDTIDIVDPGFGYKVPPPVAISGDGTAARAELELDNQGRIKQVTVTQRGKRYSTITADVRYFSILVNSDSTINGFWSIYSWDDERKVFFRKQSQAYDTTKYWSYVDWWKEGYSSRTQIDKEFNSLYEELYSETSLGSLIRIKEYGAGGWAVFEKISDSGATFLDRYSMVGRKNGTIQLDASIYDTTVYGIGFDNTQFFDGANYDIDNSKELRNIFRAVKEDIFIGNYATEWNKLFFTSMRYVLAEQQYVDWMFKTSFLNAVHNIGSFEQKSSYKSDNLESYQEYINEVKPYRTTVREYVSRYSNIEMYGSSATDFDLPATFSIVEGAVVPITTNRPELLSYPWKWWNDNHGYSVVSIEVYDSGAGYTIPPKVLIEGDGTGATAQAYISNGKVSGIYVTNGGTGYSYAPKIILVGGNPAGSSSAKASAILGDAKPRTFDLTVKFDRISKTGTYKNFTFTETIYPTGKTSVFELKYAPTRNKNEIIVYKNDQLLLSSDYSITLFYSSSDSYRLLKGKISFTESPLETDKIVIEYIKNLELFDAVNRIENYYNPVSGMTGKELNQLMTGFDFGGVQIQGTTFEVTGGWDALPWFTDNWDSVESNSDYYYVVSLDKLADSTESFKTGDLLYVESILYKCIKENMNSVGDYIFPIYSEGWEEFWELFVIVLPYTPEDGQEINVYIKRKADGKTKRIDDPSYTSSWDSSIATNPNAEMPTFVGDGSTKTIDIGSYLHLADGDILIFRPVESDGSVTITDDNLLDTRLSGGTLSAMSGAYVTATGTTAEEISITGGKFISPEQVPSPEENVPGQILDSLSLRVFHSSVSGSAPLQSKINEGNGVERIFEIGQIVLENKSVFVYIDKIKQEFGVDYSLDLKDYNVEFVSAPANGSIIEILSIGIGGIGILDYQEFIADGTTNLFLTNANYDSTGAIFVTINGERVETGFKNSTDVTDTQGKTLVEFGIFPNEKDIIKIVCLELLTDVDLSGVAIIKVNTQTSYYEGSTRSFDLTNFVELSRGSARNSMIVAVNEKVLKGSDTVYAVYNGTNNAFTLGTDPYEPPGTILPTNIRVFINNKLATFITDYVFDGPTKVLTITKSLTVGDIIKIQNDIRAEYRINGDILTILPDVDIGIVTNETDNVKIDITWFSEYPSMDVVSDQKEGGKVNYKLSRLPISASYVWVYKNGQRLTQDKDYYVSLPRGVLYLNVDTTATDDIKTISFTRDIFRLPSAFEIHKDMLNVYHFNRYAKGEIVLTKNLNYYDTSIEVDNGDLLSEPVSSRNIPGVIYISGERIEYMAKNGNVLSQLRRGAQGTSIGEIYVAGSSVIDVGFDNTIPYKETQERIDFVSDGSTLLIGPLDFIPVKSNKSRWYSNNLYSNKGTWSKDTSYVSGNVVLYNGSYYSNIRPCKGINFAPVIEGITNVFNWELITIPDSYGPCDQVEVFAAGHRLAKDPRSIWFEDAGPTATIITEAEFSVDGEGSYIRLSEPLAAGTRITIIKRMGKVWYDRGENTASSGETLIVNDSPIAKFIAQKTTSLPE